MNAHIEPFACGRCDSCEANRPQECLSPRGGCRCEECTLARQGDRVSEPPYESGVHCSHCEACSDACSGEKRSLLARAAKLRDALRRIEGHLTEPRGSLVLALQIARAALEETVTRDG